MDNQEKAERIRKSLEALNAPNQTELPPETWKEIIEEDEEENA